VFEGAYESIHNVVHLRDGKEIEVLNNEEEFDFVEEHRLLKTEDESVHHLSVDIFVINIHQVDIDAYFE
jgi:hypothetical protein